MVCLTKHKGDEGIVGHKTPLNGDLVSLGQSEPTITSTSTIGSWKNLKLAMGLNYWKLEGLKSALGLNYWKLEGLKSALGLNYWKLEDLKSALGLNYWKLEDLKSATGPYCRQFKSSVCFCFFSHTTHLHVQDISGDAHTHLDAAQTHFGSCYALYTSLQVQNVHNMGPNCVWALSHLFLRKRRNGPRADKENKEAGNTFQFFCNVQILANFDPKISKISQNNARQEIQIFPNFFVEKWKIFTREKKKTVVPLYCLK